MMRIQKVYSFVVVLWFKLAVYRSMTGESNPGKYQTIFHNKRDIYFFNFVSLSADGTIKYGKLCANSMNYLVPTSRLDSGIIVSSDC